MRDTICESRTFSFVLLSSKIATISALSLVALDLKIDPPTATVIVAVIVACTSMWQSWMLSKVHTLVNSNFTEAKLARAAAEAALKTAQDLNLHLQRELDIKTIGPIGLTGATGETGKTGLTGPIGETGKTGPAGKG